MYCIIMLACKICTERSFSVRNQMFSWKILSFWISVLQKLFIRPFGFFSWVLQNNTPEWKCLVPGLVLCQIRQRKIMVPRQATISRRDSVVSKTVKQHFLKFAVFMSKASSSIKKWWIILSIWEITANHTHSIPNYLSYKRHVPQLSLTLISLLRPMIGFETLRGN